MNVCVRRMRGAKMLTTSSLMDEFAAALQFFDGFGSNWYALRECLQYMDEWLPADAYVLVVENANDVLRNESEDELVTLIKTFHETGEWWAKPIVDNDRFNRDMVPFHVFVEFGRACRCTANQSSRRPCGGASANIGEQEDFPDVGLPCAIAPDSPMLRSAQFISMDPDTSCVVRLLSNRN